MSDDAWFWVFGIVLLICYTVWKLFGTGGSFLG
jgi:hypothetical protein